MQFLDHELSIFSDGVRLPFGGLMPDAAAPREGRCPGAQKLSSLRQAS